VIEHVFVRVHRYVQLMDTIRRGNAAEAAVLNALVRAEVHVLVPFGEGLPYDLAIDTGDQFIKIQVKCGRVRNDCVEFNTCATDHGSGRRSYVGLADVFGVWVPELDRVYVAAVVDSPRYRGYLRLVPTRNSQSKGVRYAGDYAVERWAASLSRVAA
jgi:hypothetical protein